MKKTFNISANNYSYLKTISYNTKDNKFIKEQIIINPVSDITIEIPEECDDYKIIIEPFNLYPSEIVKM